MGQQALQRCGAAHLPLHLPLAGYPHPAHLLEVGIERAAEKKKRSNSSEKYSSESVKLLAVMDFSSASHDVISLPALLLVTGFNAPLCPPAPACSACSLVSASWETGILTLLLNPQL